MANKDAMKRTLHFIKKQLKRLDKDANNGALTNLDVCNECKALVNLINRELEVE
jgi:hypothetical protein